MGDSRTLGSPWFVPSDPRGFTLVSTVSRSWTQILFQIINAGSPPTAHCGHSGFFSAGPSRALWGAKQHPRPPPARCQELPSVTTTDAPDMGLCPQVETQWADSQSGQSRAGLGPCCPTQLPATCAPAPET